MEYFNDPQRVAERLKLDLEHGKEMFPGAAQDSTDVHCWERFLIDRRIVSIIELGTGTGKFSQWIRNKAPFFLTFDNKEPYHDIPGFILHDILNDPDDQIKIDMFCAPRPLLLYCDNGNKAAEVKLFSDYLNPGDYLGVHDFQIEIHPEDIPDGFELIINHGLTAFWRKNEWK